MSRPIHAVTMPKWGIEMTEGTIAGWRIAEGEPVERGAEIADVETEKIVNAVEAPASGVLRRITAHAGDRQPVGALLGVIAEAGTSEEEIARFVGSFVGAVVSFEPESAPAAQRVVATGVAASAAATSAAVPAASAAASPPPSSADETRVSPIARRVAERLGVDITQVTGTGRNGRISKEDVEAFAARREAAQGTGQGAAATPSRSAGTSPSAGPSMSAAHATAPIPPTATSASRRVRLSARRLTIARRLLAATQSIPHFHVAVEVDLGPLLERKRAAAPVRLTVNDFVVRASALALMQHRAMNAQLEGEEILEFEDADIAIAVAAPGGLITPIVRAAQRKSLDDIAAECRELIERARRDALRREEIEGGSFSISNLGMYGVASFDAIINPPQVAILAVGAVAPRAQMREGALAVAEMATLTLSSDHRAVDGAQAAAFLATLRGLLEHPDGL
jgi:pyruvate dehydrogenase E2 component (dihydrolipoamide acetyltransferase)